MSRIRFYNIVGILAIILMIAGCPPPSGNTNKKDVKAKVKGAVLTPLEKALVYVYKAGTDLRGPPLQTIETSALTGEYEIELPAGKYFFVARKRISAESIGLVVQGDYKSEIIGPIEITKSGDIKLDLTALRKIGDTKEAISSDLKSNTFFSGMILNSDEEPVEGIRVHVYDHIQMSERPKFVSEKTGPDGKYTMHVPAGGTYYIAARDKFGGPPKVGDLYGRYDQGTIDPTSIMIKTDEHLEGIDITVHKVW
ncbi:hypothetical protein ACFL2A_05665 [Thermodesulfobacteriota bacterium]